MPRSLAHLSLLLGATLGASACRAPAPPPKTPNSAAAAPTPAVPANELYADAIHEDVIVGSFMGMDDIAMQRIGEVFGRDHIVWSAYGSLGYTLIVRTVQGRLAREVLRADPVLAKHVSVLDPLAP